MTIRDALRSMAGAGAALVMLLAWVSCAAAQGARTTAAPEPPKLVDSDDKAVGTISQILIQSPPLAGVFPGYMAQVGLRLGGHSLFLWASAERFYSLPILPPVVPPAPSVAVIVYDGPACTGNAFVFGLFDQPLYAERLVPLYAIGTGQRLYFGEGAPVVVAGLSSWNETAQACGGAGGVIALPAVEVADLDATYPPPYRLR